MNGHRLPKYTKEKMKGNIGEALVQFVLSKFCLVHSIDGSNDIGNDFICELIKNQYPTNILFYVQVKYWATEPVISPETLEYWKDSPIPVYVFWVKDDHPLTSITFRQNVKYKRFTPYLHNPRRHSKEKYKEFDEIEFKKDVIVDYARTQYYKGFTPIIEPRAFLKLDEKIEMGLDRYMLLVKDVIPEYTKQVLQNSWVGLYTTATLLNKEKSKESWMTAVDLLKSAENLIGRDNRELGVGFFRDKIRTLKEDLVKKISQGT